MGDSHSDMFDQIVRLRSDLDAMSARIRTLEEITEKNLRAAISMLQILEAGK